jgi:hypothetical protein
MTSRKMEQSISTLRKCGWKVDVDDVTKRIVLRDPFPEVNWLHLLRQEVHDEPKN